MAEKSKKHEVKLSSQKCRERKMPKKQRLSTNPRPRALRAKTEQLKALRLAKEDAAVTQQPAAAIRKPARRKKAKSGSLSEWLGIQAKEGRRG